MDGDGQTTLGPGETDTPGGGETDTPTGPASFEVSGMDPSNVTVTQGDTVAVSVTVTNVGNDSGTGTVTVTMDGTQTAQRSVTLDAGESTTEAFDVDTSDVSLGDHTVTISTESSQVSGTLTVEAPDPSADTLSVMLLGGPEGGSHNAPDRQVQITEYLRNRGIEVWYTDRQDDLLEETLHDYDAWILIDNRSGLTQEQEDSLVNFVENEGGGFVALHSASACFTESDRFIEHLGGQFESHGYGEMTTNREQSDHPVYTGVEDIVVEDETYRHTNLNPENDVLAFADFPDYGENEEPEPWTWVREEGEGRVFYTAWGHGPAPWAEPGFKKLVENAIRWTSGNEDTIAEDTRSLDSLEFTDANVPFYPGGETQQTVPEEVGSGTDWNKMQEPLPPDQTENRTITAEGFDLQYFVTEETLPDGVAGNILDFDFDHRGRVYLAMSQDYPNAVAEGGDSIVIAEDTDGDGRADEFTVFAEGLSVPNSIAVAYGGVYVANTGHTESEGAMLFLEDTNDDDVAEETTVLFSGYNNGDTHAGPNELVVGIDNWLWGQVGYSGFSGEVGGTQHNFSSAIYRFRPDGSELQIMGSLPGNQAGIGFDEEGLTFASAATSGQPSNYLAIPGPYYQYINGVDSSGMAINIADTNRFLPATDRIRQVDQHGGYTAAAGQSVYTARRYPRKYWNSAAFVSDGTGCLLGTFWKEPDGAGFTAHNANNLVASTDAWFAPTYSYVGPDANVWFADLYEYIYQHNPTPSGFDNGEGNAYETMLRDKQYTRLVTLEYGDGQSQQLDLGDASPDELVDALSHDNMFWRQEAQQQLVQRGETDVVSDLVSVIENDSPDGIGIAKGAVHALWTLHGLGALEEGASSEATSAAMGALSHSSAAVRLNAVRVLPGTAGVRDAILDNGLVTDDNMRVRMWALLALAEAPASDAAGEAIFELMDVESNFEDEVLREAALIGGGTNAQGFISAYESTYGVPRDGTNVFDANGGFEQIGDVGPEGWTQNVFAGSPEFTWATDASTSGDHSLKISASEGTDSGWSIAGVPVEPNTTYTLSAMVKTENVETGDPPSWAVDDFGAPYGACLNVEQLANAEGLGAEAISDDLTGTNDWTEITLEFDSLDYEELQFNCLFGAYASSATGTVWFDDVSVVGPDGNDVVPNGDAESGQEVAMPAGWSTTSFVGSGEFALDTETAQFDSNSATISSDSGLDGAWNTTVSIDDNTEYELVGWIKTDDVQTLSDGTRGALLNVHLSSVETEALTGTNDWSEVSVTFDSGNLPDDAWTDGRGSSIQINALFGGFGQATGTAWFDGIELWDPNAEEEAPNVADNPSFEETDTEVGPDAWETNTWGGSAEYTWVEGAANTGDHSLEITSSEGADAVWWTTVSVESNTEYTLGGSIKTENVQNGSGLYGASFNVDQVGGAGDDDVVAGQLTGTNDWTEVSTTLNSGDSEELTVNCLFGGFGEATGTAWFDDIYLEDPDGNNVLPNAGFESGTSTSMPTGWESNTWGGSATFVHDNDVSRSGDYSARIDSSDGADASWTQVRDVTRNTEYRFSAYVKTSDDFGLGDGFAGGPFGATLNIHQLGQESLPDTGGSGISEPGTDWTRLETTFNSGDNEELWFNCLFGGWGSATGTAWWDDVSVQPLGDIGEGIAGMYDRIKQHLRMETSPTAEFTASTMSAVVGSEVTFDASGSSTPNDSIDSYEWEFGDGTTATGQTASHTYGSTGEYTVTLTVTDNIGATASTSATIDVTAQAGLDPSTTIELEAQSNQAWTGVAPTAIEGENPTLSLREGEEYTVEWTNVNGGTHNFVIETGDGSTPVETGFGTGLDETQTVTFTATADMIVYYCSPHRGLGMEGSIEIV
jgi:putative membrane-bound dehydrogenase-like protein